MKIPLVRQRALAAAGSPVVNTTDDGDPMSVRGIRGCALVRADQVRAVAARLRIPDLDRNLPADRP
jgi:hypothetical protein